MTISSVFEYLTPTGRSGQSPNIIGIACDNTLAEVETAGFLTPVQLQPYSLRTKDVVLLSYDVGTAFFTVTISASQVITLTLILQTSITTVAGDFAQFADTGGTLVDNGISPSDPTKDVVAMVTAATTSGRIAQFNDTAGTIGTGPVAAGVILTSGITTPDVGPNLITFDITVGQAALAAAGHVALITSSGAKQYRIRQLQLNKVGTAFSGGGGDRLLQITDGTSVYSVVPATNIQTLVNALWGVSTPLPSPASVSFNTPTVAGANLYAAYSGGSADYTAGSLVISGIAERIA